MQKSIATRKALIVCILAAMIALIFTGCRMTAETELDIMDEPGTEQHPEPETDGSDDIDEPEDPDEEPGNEDADTGSANHPPAIDASALPLKAVVFPEGDEFSLQQVFAASGIFGERDYSGRCGYWRYT